jgi:hypothetical protein
MDFRPVSLIHYPQKILVFYTLPTVHRSKKSGAVWELDLFQFAGESVRRQTHNYKPHK